MSTCAYFVQTSGNTSILAIVGNGSYVNCGTAGEFLKSLTERSAKADLVVDFSRCTAVDSTLLGMLTRTALDFAEKTPRGRVIFVNIDGRPLEAVKNLGLHHVVEVVESPVKSGADTAATPLTPVMCATECILDAHRALVLANEENEPKFHDVIEALASMR